jgi:hypothetical protein
MGETEETRRESVHGLMGKPEEKRREKCTWF